MLRICALNEDSDDSSSCSDNENASEPKDAETAILSEYLDALKLKDQNQLDKALAAFLKLIDSEVLINITNDAQNKLFMIKYNCHRNIGLIYKEKNDSYLALEHLCKAVDMDETDVYTVYSLAKLAFSIGQIHIAKICYEKCVARNPDHWPSLEGLLQLFCETGNVIEAFAWAMHCYRKDSTYKGAINVLAEIKTYFLPTVPFLEELFQVTFRKDEALKQCTITSKHGYFLPRLLDIS
ncbi:calcineurin-binding protein cabin-1-like [Wyeomyia smithii]|uniref:calcineurin-binding protein cabin-1-like n=1 Tax=Wyeomyia smithii TaxID=174621 RepID=UPI0024682228|nr:calcineurin-binding protein cabin-1-like [Wyeomyia smithii]